MAHSSMRTLVVIVLTIVTAISVATTKCFGSSPAVYVSVGNDAVARQYVQINDAIIKHDLNTLMSFFTSDFTEVNSSGAIVDRNEERKDYQNELAKIESMNIQYFIVDSNTTPAGTYCDVRFHMDGVGFKRILFMKVKGAFTNDLIVRDFWVTTPDGLRLKSRQTSLDETRISTN
jgi:hypothetical protein